MCIPIVADPTTLTTLATLTHEHISSPRCGSDVCTFSSASFACPLRIQAFIRVDKHLPNGLMSGLKSFGLASQSLPVMRYAFIFTEGLLHCSPLNSSLCFLRERKDVLRLVKGVQLYRGAQTVKQLWHFLLLWIPPTAVKTCLSVSVTWLLLKPRIYRVIIGPRKIRSRSPWTWALHRQGVTEEQ